MEGVENPFHIRLGNRLSGNVARQGYGGDGDKVQGVKDSKISTKILTQFILEDVMLSNIICSNTGPVPIIIAGLKNHPVKRVTLRNITVISAKSGSSFDIDTPPNWDGSGYPVMLMYGTKLPAYGLVTYSTEGLVLENLRFLPAPKEPRPPIKHYLKK